MDGLALHVNGEEIVLEIGAPLEVHKAQYGYRRSPQLWQKWVAAELEAVGLERSRADSTMFFSAQTGVMVTFHVDDFVILGDTPAVLALFEKLQAKMVGRLAKPGDTGEFLRGKAQEDRVRFRSPRKRALG